jgi:hypothetical protein
MESTNAVYRKNVGWNKLMSNARAFIETGGFAHWDMLVYKHNQHQVNECKQLAQDMGFKWFRAKVSKRGFTDRLEQPIGWSTPTGVSSVIDCHALKEKSIYIDAQGRLGPCCWLGSRQADFVTDVDSIPTQDLVCASACGSTAAGTAFEQQWQKEWVFQL